MQVSNRLACGVIISVAFLSAGVAPAAYTNTFDTSNAPFRFDYTSGTVNNTTTEFNSAYNTTGPTGSGSAEFDQTFVSGGTGASFTGDVFGTVTPVYNISFDLLVDPTSVSGTGNHGAGYFEVFLRYTDNYNSTSVYNENLGNPGYDGVTHYNVWEHISIDLDGTASPASSVRAITFQDYNNDNLSGTVKYYVDNLVIATTPTPEPASLGMLALAIPALLKRKRA